jgi:hypothetical protein
MDLIQSCLLGKVLDMTIREELMREIEQAPDEVLQALLTILRLTQTSHTNMSIPVHGSDVTHLAPSKHHPLRGLPLVIAADFDAPMTELWDALGS